MKITIYELLGLIKNGKAPKEVKYNETKYVFNEDKQCYENSYEWFPLIQEIGLNKKVEILDEEDEFIDIEELDVEYDDDGRIDGVYMGRPEVEERKIINDLIKNQKKIINKLKEEGK